MVSSKKQNKTSNRDQYTVVLEGLRSDFKVFGEALGLVDNKVDNVIKRVNGIDLRLDGIDGRLDKIDGRLSKVESSLEILKGEVALIRHNQVTRDEFKLLESRVLRLEKNLA